VTADDRYDVSGLPEAQFEPGSHALVLKNLLGITSKHIMDEAEARALESKRDELVSSVPTDAACELTSDRFGYRPKDVVGRGVPTHRRK
jgi:hypothetical protein